MRGFHRLVLGAGLGLLAVLFAAMPADAAYPRIILVSGAELEEPIVLASVDDIVDVTTAIARAPSVPPEEVEGRAYLRLSLFWGDDLWEPYVREGRLNELRPEQANQEGRFYPANGAQEAVIDLLVNGRAGPKHASEEALATLTRNGVPVSFPVDPDGQAQWPWITGGVVAGLASVAALGMVAYRRRSRPTPV
jgi:hypothetical protein